MLVSLVTLSLLDLQILNIDCAVSVSDVLLSLAVLSLCCVEVLCLLISSHRVCYRSAFPGMTAAVTDLALVYETIYLLL